MNWSLDALTGQTEKDLCLLDDFLVHPHVVSDFIALKTAAEKAGFELAIASSFRGFERQTWIWNNKFLGLRPVFDDKGNALDMNLLNEEEKIFAILRWSALPGASRHHWGTDLDVYAKNLLPSELLLQLAPWEYLTGHQAPFFDWLKKHLFHDGFYFPYEKDRGGVAVEQWHISHQATTAGLLGQLTSSTLKRVIELSDIEGKDAIIFHLDRIYERFISNVSSPSKYTPHL